MFNFSLTVYQIANVVQSFSIDYFCTTFGDLVRYHIRLNYEQTMPAKVQCLIVPGTLICLQTTSEGNKLVTPFLTVRTQVSFFFLPEAEIISRHPEYIQFQFNQALLKSVLQEL